MVALLALGGCFTSACIYDDQDRCDAHEHNGPNKSCVCDEGYIFKDGGCLACGDHEAVQANACVCEPGYARSGDDTTPCAATTSGLGLACDQAANGSDCADPENATCRDHGGGAGYCTHACATDQDCTSGFVCDTKGSSKTCKSQAAGEFAACTTDADCATDPQSPISATLCDTTSNTGCRVQGCKLDDPLTCSDAFQCCDLTKLGLPVNVCFPEGTCP